MCFEVRMEISTTFGASVLLVSMEWCDDSADSADELHLSSGRVPWRGIFGPHMTAPAAVLPNASYKDR